MTASSLLKALFWPKIYFQLTGEYPIDFNSTPVHGNKSKNLYRSTSCAVSFPSNSLS